MRLATGLILTLRGTAIILDGVGDALLDLTGMHETALDAPCAAGSRRPS